MTSKSFFVIFFVIFFVCSLGKNTDENCGKINGDEGTCFGPDSSEQSDILYELNHMRNKVANGTFICNCTSGFCPKAEKMPKLIWSVALASSAQDYINAKGAYTTHGVYKDSSYQSHSEKSERYSSAYNHCGGTCAANIQSGDKIGENIYRRYSYSSSSTPPRKIYDIDYLIYKASNSWDVDEAAEYCPGDTDYNHFTQNVWEETVYMGCGVGLFYIDPTGDQKKTYNLIVCQYYERGNMKYNGVYVPPYTSTTGSVSCDSGFQVDSEYDHLCAKITPSPTASPVVPAPAINNKGKDSNGHKGSGINMFNPSEFSFIEVIIWVFIVVIICSLIAGCVMIRKRRETQNEDTKKNADLHTELSGDVTEVPSIKVVDDPTQNQGNQGYNPKAEKTTFGDNGQITNSDL